MDVGVSDDGGFTPSHREPLIGWRPPCDSKFELIACLEGPSVDAWVGCAMCHPFTNHGFPRFQLRYHGPDWRDKRKRQGHSHERD